MTNLAQRVRERLAFDEPSAIKFCDSCEDGFLDHESFQRGCRWYYTTHVKGLEKLLVSMAEGLEDINEGTASSLEDMEHYFENKCCPTVDEVNQFSQVDSKVRYLRAQLEQWLKEGE